MNNLQKVKKLEDFPSFLQGVEPCMGSFGGRKFLTKDTAYTLKEIVKKLQEFTQRKNQDHLLVSSVLENIKKLDEKGNQVVLQQSFIIQIITKIRQFFGNFSYNKKAVLEEMEKLVIRKEAYKNLSEEEYRLAIKNMILTGKRPESIKDLPLENIEGYNQQTAEKSSIALQKKENLDFYIQTVIQQFYICYPSKKGKKNIKNSPEFNHLLEIVSKNILFDFPSIKKSPEEIKAKISNAFNKS